MAIKARKETKKTRYEHVQTKLTAKHITVTCYKEDDTIGAPTGDMFRFDRKEEVQEGAVLFSHDSCKAAISHDGRKLFQLSPYKGTFHVKFAGFNKDRSGIPTRKPKPARWVRRRDGKGEYEVPAHSEFTAKFVVTKGKFKGTELIRNYWYLFQRDDESGEAYVGGSGRRHDEVWDFLERIGYNTMEDTIMWSDNVLYDIENKGLEEECEFLVVVDEGWINEFAEAADE